MTVKKVKGRYVLVQGNLAAFGVDYGDVLRRLTALVWRGRKK
jgi:hypothetical protein